MVSSSRPSLAKPTSQPRARSRERREQLLNDLESLILAEGFSGLTMGDIAARLRCSKSTLYALSRSREGLVVAVLRRYFAATQLLVERQVALARTQRERIALYLSALGHQLKRMSTACYEDVMLLPATREVYEQRSHAAAMQVHELIERGIDSSELRSANGRFVGKAVSLLIDGIQHGGLLEGTGLSSGDAFEELSGLVLNALTNRASLELPAEPFVPGDGGVRPDLPARVGFANLGDAEIFEIWGQGVRSAAERRGLECVTLSAGFDSATNIEQLRELLDRDVGALLVVELEAPAQRPVMMEAMEAGVAVLAVPFGPSTAQIVTDQYAAGKAAAAAMVDFIDDHLDGHAEILVFNLDDREGLRPRYQAVRDVVAAAGDGIRIVVDQLTTAQTPEFGFEVMRGVLRREPAVRVVIGEDAHVLGALAALREAGVDRDPGWLLVGIGGERHALAEVADAGSPLRIDVAFALPAIGVLAGRFAADWLAGRTIPTMVTFNPIVLDSTVAVDRFLADVADPEALVDGLERETYLRMRGTTSYASWTTASRAESAARVLSTPTSRR